MILELASHRILSNIDVQRLSEKHKFYIKGVASTPD